MPRSVLVTYGTANGSTGEIAHFTASVPRQEGLRSKVRPPSEVADPAPYDTVVIGGALCTGRRHRDAGLFALQHRRALRERPVRLFSSGLLDPSASKRDIPPVRGARRALDRTRARDVARLIPHDHRGGDFRDFGRIAEWAAGVVRELEASPKEP